MAGTGSDGAVVNRRSNGVAVQASGGKGRNAKAELQVKDNGGSSAAGLRLLKSAQPASDAPLSLRGRSPWQSASSKAIDFGGTYDKNGAFGGTDSSLQAQNDPEVSNRNANLQAQRVNTEPSADTQAAGRDSGVEAYVQRLREVMAGTGSDVTGANGQGISVNSGGTPLGGYTASGLSGHLLLPGEGNTAVSNSGTDAQVRQSDAGKFGVEQYGELLHQAGLDWDTAGKLSEIGLRVPSKIAESRSMAAPNVTAIPSGSMKAAGAQHTAKVTDAEGYARRLQEAVPELAMERGLKEGGEQLTRGRKSQRIQGWSHHNTINEQSPRPLKQTNFSVNWNVVQNEAYKKKFSSLSSSPEANTAAYVRAKWALNNRDGNKTEELYALDMRTGNEIARITDQHYEQGVKRTKNFDLRLNAATRDGADILLIHNHPAGMPPSISDINILAGTKMRGIVAGHDGSIYLYTAPSKKIPVEDFDVAIHRYKEYTNITSFEKALTDLSKEFGFNFIKL